MTYTKYLTDPKDAFLDLTFGSTIDFATALYKLQKIIDIVTCMCYHKLMDDNVYTTSEVVHITGFSVRQLDYWARQGIVIPSIQQSYGPGSRRLYAIDDLVRLNFIRQLKHHSWSTQKIRKAITILSDVMNDTDPLKSAILFHGKGTIFALCKTKKGERILLDALNVGGQQVMKIVLEMLEEETRDGADRFIQKFSLDRDKSLVEQKSE